MSTYDYLNNITQSGFDFLPNNFTGNTTPGGLAELSNKINIISKNNDIGFIAQDFETTIEVWNTYSESVYINDIIISDPSIEVLNNGLPITFPYLVPASASRVFTLFVSGQGKFQINDSIEFITSKVNAFAYVTGFRSFVIDFPHNWIEEFTEKYTFGTDINKSITLAEQRSCNTDLCKYQCEFNYLLKEEQKQVLQGIFYNNVDVVYSIPLHIYSTMLVSDVAAGSLQLTINDVKHNIFQKDMLVMIKDPVNRKYEIVTIESVDVVNNKLILKDVTINPQSMYFRVIPLIQVRTFGDIEEVRLTSHISQFSVLFQKEQDNIDMLVTNYNSLISKVDDINYLEVVPNLTAEVDVSYNNNDVAISNDFGKIEHFKYNEVSEVSLSYTHVMHRKEDFSYMKNIFSLQLGMYNDLYSDSFSQDVKIIENILNTDTIIKIKNINASNMFRNKNIKYINIKVGTSKKIVEFIDIYKVDANIEAIVLKEAIGMNINKDWINYTNFMFLGRFNSDDLLLNYTTDGIAQAEINFLKNTDV